jgi:imidazolonepropionase-like amidohydrolase
VATLVCAAVGFAATEPDVIVFQHANVIDGQSTAPVVDVSVSIAGGKIVSIGSAVPVPNGATVIDLKGKWLLPGYVDAHVHFPNFETARNAVQAGTTTARTMAGERFVDIAIREAHRGGERDVPEVQAAGYQVRPDMVAAFYTNFPELADLRPRVTGTEGVRRVVRALASRGVDHIKLLATERAGTPETDPRKQTFSDEEIAAIVDEARRVNLPVAAHAYVDGGARAAIAAGVHSIEHGAFLSAEALQVMREKGTFLVPTCTVSNLPARAGEHPILAERRREFWPALIKTLQAAEKLGIPIAGGTDMQYRGPGNSMAGEARYLQQAGLSAMKALQAVTFVSAACLGIEQRTGSIRPGMEADLIVVVGDPLADLASLDDLRLVVNDGTVVMNKLEPER